MFSVNELEYEAKMEQLASTGQRHELSLREISKRRQITSAKCRLLALQKSREEIQNHRGHDAKARYQDAGTPQTRLGHPGRREFNSVCSHIWHDLGPRPRVQEAAIYMMPYGYVPLDDVVNVSGTAAAEQFIASPDLFVQGMLHGGEGTVEFMSTAATQNMGGVINDLAVNATPMTEPLAYIAGVEVGSSGVVELARKTVSAPSGRLMNVRRKADRTRGAEG
ncbi:hypothetical protein L207DRAFT_521471 [Hyaloscypha variabilis F]|uniref:Uncharacterized protein n=1 Tax=Hyaloscypha variabilis (strain UAMH 11265 / GT02V1 / F) TaxID=1149755 RepID=A0A2J6SBC0_HYAVF|nr:hypothetical protein L207DRAFT_521471 [Hyaloscypha variabilis F]